MPVPAVSQFQTHCTNSSTLGDDEPALLTIRTLVDAFTYWEPFEFMKWDAENTGSNSPLVNSRLNNMSVYFHILQESYETPV